MYTYMDVLSEINLIIIIFRLVISYLPTSSSPDKLSNIVYLTHDL